ncbi:hypothetical protein [Okeania sp.]|uniref:hypothetical protein n=1 Tax=Okeania sp. TaxID=3100323 RepID=UPI002B4B789A|nr:hypothetical protein [Okeania sp.]MEB3342237.1 hypothetical protein [Okeania sp.]
MKKITSILAISSLLSFGISFVAIASPAVTTMQLSLRVSCQDAIASVKRKIQQNRNILVRFEARDIANYGWETGKIPRGKKILEINMGEMGMKGMKGNRQDMLNVMNSPKLLSSLASEVINGCNDVSGINIGISHTDYGRMYGLVGDRVQPFKCLSADRSRRNLPWGYMVCL